MAKREKKENSSNGELRLIDRAVQNIFTMLDSSYAGKEAISSKDAKIRAILNRELDISKGVSNGSIIDFVSSVRNEAAQSATANKTAPNNKEDMFSKNINDIFGYFQQEWQNRFLEMKDYQFIAKFIPSVGRAVDTQLNAITASDSISDSINFSFNLGEGVTQTNREAIMSEIRRQEKNAKLRKKLKNIVFKKTIVTGTHYVYAVAYEKIFQEYAQRKNQGTHNAQNMATAQFSSNHNKATESYMLGDVDVTEVFESFIPEIQNAGGSRFTKSQSTKVIREWENILPHFTCTNESILSDAMESASCIDGNPVALESIRSNLIKDEQKSSENKNTDMKNWFDGHMSPDATKDMEDAKHGKTTTFGIPGTYIKYIDAKDLVPYKVFDTVIAYAYVHEKSKKKKSINSTGITSIGQSLFGTLSYSQNKQDAAIHDLTDAISDGILKCFDKPFLTKNAEFKELIANCIVSKGLTDKDYDIQIIPAEDIIVFNIDEDENGYGTSMLEKSIFYGKLLLTLVVSRLLNYINKTGNRTIAHIHKGPIGTLEDNMVDRVIRDLQDGDVTFNDLMSPNLVFNKFNRNGSIQMPMAKNGNRLIELETQEGQTIEMDPEYEKKLEQMTLIGTGVPLTVMDMDNTTDFAKEIISAYIEFAGTTSGRQSDLEDPTTELYRRLLKNSSLTDEQKRIVDTSLSVNLPRPRVRTNENTAEFIQSALQTADEIASLIIGKESLQGNTDPILSKKKEMLQFEIAKIMMPFIDWELYEKQLKDVETTMEMTEKENGDSTESF